MVTKVTEEVYKNTRQFFFAIENTAKTSPKDIEDMNLLLDAVVEKYNMKFCQATWKSNMVRLNEDGNKKVGQ